MILQNLFTKIAKHQLRAATTLTIPLDLEKETSQDESVEEGERQEKYDAF
jgi:hypothetical protein